MKTLVASEVGKMDAKGSDPDLQNHIRFAMRAVDTALQCGQALQARDPVTDSDLHAITLHATLLELLTGCVALAGSGCYTGMPVLLRAMYERLVDLDNVVHVKGYHQRLEAANLQDMIRSRRGPETRAGRSSVATRGDPRFLMAELENLARANQGPLSFEERCALAGRSEECERLSGMFRLDAQNDLATALLDQRIVDDQPGADCGPELQGPSPSESAAARLDLGVEFLIQSARLLDSALGSTASAIDELAREQRSTASATCPALSDRLDPLLRKSSC